ncbi:MAG TPA: DegT/DnrJ/EryC1/StrS family aminotransferase [Chthoniobacterales bacterium]|jgi:dTDP-4-amino-4,6-dideoxygalactose transaminase|nr:DegT/DnrJ/EryC1/StrS family aminotransferase [Chthoniobacterales bacterium]
MRVRLLDLSGQYRSLENEIRAAADDVLASQRFILGPNLTEFENAVARYCGVPHGIGVSSGTDALLAVFMALEIGLGDAVITTDYSFFATGGCVARVGATPVFIDIEPDTYNISASALRRYIEKHCQVVEGKLVNENRQLIRALVPAHLFGLCCDMNEMIAVAREHNLVLIEDAAQAIGAEFQIENGAAKAGAMGDVGCFSFYPSKNLGAAGDAGLIVCHHDEFAERIRVCRQHGMEARYEHQFIGGNFRMDELQAAILNVKLPHLDGWSAARREAAEFYTNEFERAGLRAKVQLPVEPYAKSGLKNHHIYHQYVIRTEHRDDLREHLSKHEIETAIYYPLALHQQPCFEYLGYKAGDFPEAARAARETLALPIYPEIERDAQKYVVNCISEFFG